MIDFAPKPASIRISAGEAGDLDGVMEVMATAFDPDFGEGWTRSQCAGILPLSGVTLTLAHDEAGKAQGFSLVRTVADEAELLLLAVAPEAQKRGIGGALLREFVELAQDMGVRRLHLEVRDGNPAIAMYQSFGFQAAGRRAKYYCGHDGRHHDAVTMAQQL